MNIEEIKALFLTEYNKKSEMRPKIQSGSERPVANYNYHVYSYGALPVLIQQLKDIPRDPDESYEQDQLSRFSVRYIVDLDWNLWFAQEGKTGGSVPAHSDMRSKSYAAGNIFFSEDYKLITKITNKSGHFQPLPASLMWAIAALNSVEAPFAETVIMEIQASQDAPLTLTSDELLSLLPKDSFQKSRADFMVEVHSLYDTDEITDLAGFNSFRESKNKRSLDEAEITPLEKKPRTSSSSSLSFFKSNITLIPQNNAYATPPQSPRINT